MNNKRTKYRNCIIWNGGAQCIQGESKSIVPWIFADYSETAENFNINFYTFIQRFISIFTPNKI